MRLPLRLCRSSGVTEVSPKTRAPIEPLEFLSLTGPNFLLLNRPLAAGSTKDYIPFLFRVYFSLLACSLF